jgi:SulP family sulfate permease
MIGGRHRSNMELVGQGIANIVTPLFGGIPATGAIARTATNVKNGGRTPVAGIVHAVTLLLITLFFARFVAAIPLAVLAAILVIVAYHMSEWRTFAAELRAPGSDVIVLLATFGLTVLVDLTVAIQVGMVLAAFLFMRRMAEVTNVSMVTRELRDAPDEADANAASRREIPDGVVVYEVNGPFFFGAADRFRETLGQVGRQPKVLIVRMRNVPAMDSTGLRALTDVYQKNRHAGALLLLSDIHAQPMMALARSRLLDRIGDDNLFGNLDDALNRARAHLGLPPTPKPEWASPTVRRERPADGTDHET